MFVQKALVTASKSVAAAKPNKTKVNHLIAASLSSVIAVQKRTTKKSKTTQKAGSSGQETKNDAVLAPRTRVPTAKGADLLVTAQETLHRQQHRTNTSVSSEAVDMDIV